MPETVGAQQNPMRHLGGTLTPSGAYSTHLTGDWETFLYGQALVGDAPARPHQAQKAE